ncbi:MAG TPA: hypothetical protein VIG33_09715 [Pseudobdellovibrionaceae bacterium]|jgi:hypothetical protein
MKSLKLVAIGICLMASASFAQAFSNGNITCTLSNGTVVNFDIIDCTASISKWVAGGIFPHGGWGISFTMNGSNACKGRRNLHLDYSNGVLYNGSYSSAASCEAW